MKRSGAIILTFYFVVFMYFLFVKPVVIGAAIVILGVTLLFTIFVKDVVLPKFFKS
jgi:hypothetical protein